MKRLICCLTWVLLWVSGADAVCQDRYGYESIRKEYAGAVCDPDAVAGVSAGRAAAVCVLEKPVTLTEAITIALKNNPDNRMAMARVAQAEAMVKKARAAFYPILGFYTEYMQGDSPSAYFFKNIDQRNFSAGGDFNYPGWFENFESGVQGQLNLFNGGRDILNKKMSDAGLAKSLADRRAVENFLVAAVIQGYYDHWAADDFVRIAKESEATVATELKLMRVRLEAGGALRSDVLSLEVRLAQAREEVVKSTNQRKMAVAALANLLGVSPDREIVLNREDTPSLQVPKEYEGGVVQALKTRPELKKVREMLRQSRMGLDSALSGYLPRVDLKGKYYHDDPDMSYEHDRENWTIALMLNWNFFSGFSTSAETQNARARIEELLATDRKTILEIQLDVKNAYLKFAEAWARLEVAERSVAAAEESLELVKKQFEGGSATITRYLEAELGRNTAKIRATRAFYDRQQAEAEIGRAIGVLGGMFLDE